MLIFTTQKDMNWRTDNAWFSWFQLGELGVFITSVQDGMPLIEYNEFGTPILPSLFKHCERSGNYDLLAYVNSDIILLPDFVEAAGLLDKLLPRFLMVGRRWNWQKPRPISIDDLDRHRVQFVQEVKTNGRLFNPATDYFGFRRGTFDYSTWPEFAIGRYYWDPWIIWHALQLGIPVVDCTQAVFAIHQNHPPAHRSWDEEGMRNLALAKDSEEAGIDLNNATHILTSELELVENVSKEV